MPSLLDVYLADVEWRNSKDRRPCLIVRVTPDGRFGCAHISSAMDLFIPERDFLIDAKTPGFAETGLKRTSFVTSRALSVLEERDLIRRLGRLQNPLREQFRYWWWARGGDLIE
ncbi:MAG: hypothetical protein AB1486_02050 [Planctomycetota bacterium]